MADAAAALPCPVASNAAAFPLRSLHSMASLEGCLDTEAAPEESIWPSASTAGQTKCS